MIYNTPHIINFESIGSPDLGFISVAEVSKNIPFEIKRVYWTYYTPQNVTRGFHAHKNLQQLIFAVSGDIIFYTENINGDKFDFHLNKPDKGLYLPPMIWREIKFSHNAVLLCLASEEFYEDDYLRNYKDFLKQKNK